MNNVIYKLHIARGWVVVSRWTPVPVAVRGWIGHEAAAVAAFVIWPLEIASREQTNCSPCA